MGNMPGEERRRGGCRVMFRSLTIFASASKGAHGNIYVGQFDTVVDTIITDPTSVSAIVGSAHIHEQRTSAAAISRGWRARRHIQPHAAAEKLHEAPPHSNVAANYTNSPVVLKFLII